jgi:hypothetical protein
MRDHVVVLGERSQVLMLENRNQGPGHERKAFTEDLRETSSPAALDGERHRPAGNASA